MQRLTQKDDQGNWSLKGVAWESLYEGQVVTKELRERLYGALWKLMEYEDAGLTPEEVEQLKESQKWIPVEERLPEEHESIFAKLKGTDKWSPGMFEVKSDAVNVTIEFDDGTKKTESSYTLDGRWKCEKERSFVKKKVVAWMPLPEPYQED